MIKVELDRFKPRPHQRALFDAIENKGYKRAIITWSRRNGKDVSAFNLMVRMALREVGSYIYCLPLFSQARNVIWNSILDDGTKFVDFINPELIESKNQQRMSIKLINGSDLYLGGSDSYNTLVGINVRGIVFSEASRMDPLAYTYLKPILDSNGGWCVWISTPFGENFYHDYWKMALANPQIWFTDFKTAIDTGNISMKEINEAIERGEISWEHAQQEYLCSFSLGATGSFYQHELNAMNLKGQIGDHVVYDHSKPVYTAWDLGLDDYTVVLFYQVHGRSIHIIEEICGNGKSIHDYIREVLAKPDYRYETHFGPHDLKHRVMGDVSALNRWEIAKRAGLTFKVLKISSFADGIELVRATTTRIFINARCVGLIKALNNYRRQFDKQTKRFLAKEVHDIHSDFCDTLRYLCGSLELIESDKGRMTPEALEKIKNKALYGSSLGSNSPFVKRNQTKYY